VRPRVLLHHGAKQPGQQLARDGLLLVSTASNDSTEPRACATAVVAPRHPQAIQCSNHTAGRFGSALSGSTGSSTARSSRPGLTRIRWAWSRNYAAIAALPLRVGLRGGLGLGRRRGCGLACVCGGHGSGCGRRLRHRDLLRHSRDDRILRHGRLLRRCRRHGRRGRAYRRCALDDRGAWRRRDKRRGRQCLSRRDDGGRCSRRGGGDRYGGGRRRSGRDGRRLDRCGRR
jgi:hypothetical protein